MPKRTTVKTVETAVFANRKHINRIYFICIVQFIFIIFLGLVSTALTVKSLKLDRWLSETNESTRFFIREELYNQNRVILNMRSLLDEIEPVIAFETMQLVDLANQEEWENGGGLEKYKEWRREWIKKYRTKKFSGKKSSK